MADAVHSYDASSALIILNFPFFLQTAMSDLQKNFIEISIARLQELQEELSKSKELTTSEINKFLRQIHTIKGTAQTFGLNSAAAFAHKIESYLTASESFRLNFDSDFFSEALKTLELILENSEFEISAELLTKLKIEKFSDFPDTLSELPKTVVSRLSASEKKAVSFAIQCEENLFLIEMFCALSDFPERLKRLRSQIEETGQVLAILPLPLRNSQIGAQLLCSGNVSRELFDAKIVYHKNNKRQISIDLFGVCQALSSRVQKIALEQQKSVSVELEVPDITLTDIATEKVFKILLHLTGNSVDHGLETTDERAAKEKPFEGQISIKISTENKYLQILISDDGRGIDPQLVFEKAMEKNLIKDDLNLSSKQKRELIFLGGFSTSQKISEVSGRGVGLEVVRETVEAMGGEISLESTISKGTTFKILLPSDIISTDDEKSKKN